MRLALCAWAIALLPQDARADNCLHRSVFGDGEYGACRRQQAEEDGGCSGASAHWICRVRSTAGLSLDEFGRIDEFLREMRPCGQGSNSVCRAPDGRFQLPGFRPTTDPRRAIDNFDQWTARGRRAMARQGPGRRRQPHRGTIPPPGSGDETPPPQPPPPAPAPTNLLERTVAATGLPAMTAALRELFRDAQLSAQQNDAISRILSTLPANERRRHLTEWTRAGSPTDAAAAMLNFLQQSTSGPF